MWTQTWETLLQETPQNVIYSDYAATWRLMQLDDLVIDSWTKKKFRMGWQLENKLRKYLLMYLCAGASQTDFSKGCIVNDQCKLVWSYHHIKFRLILKKTFNIFDSELSSSCENKDKLYTAKLQAENILIQLKVWLKDKPDIHVYAFILYRM